MEQVDQLRVFCRVVETNGFGRAAESLAMPKSTVSTAVRDLERRAGARLLHRTTRQLAVTEEGRSYYRHAVAILGEVDDLDQMFTGTRRAAGMLRVDVPGRLGRKLLIPNLPEFLDRYPAIDIDLRLGDRPIDLVRDGVDCVLRLGTLADSDLFARPLAQLRQVTCASPSYVSLRGAPERPAELDGHAAVHYIAPATGRNVPLRISGATGIRSVALPGRVSVNNIDAYMAAGEAGLGLIQIPEVEAAPLVRAGRMVIVLTDFPPPLLPLSLL